jgi:hypothetical protein
VKASVKVREYPDGTLAVFHGPRRIACYDAEGAELLVPTAGSPDAVLATAKAWPGDRRACGERVATAKRLGEALRTLRHMPVDGYLAGFTNSWLAIHARSTEPIGKGCNLTASQISAQISREIARTCRTSRQQSLADCVNRSAMEGRDRVGDVTLRPQRRRLGVGNHGVGQAFRI